GLPQVNQSGSAEGATYHSLGQRPRFAAANQSRSAEGATYHSLGNATGLPQANQSRSAEGATYHSLGQRPRLAASKSITQRWRPHLSQPGATPQVCRNRINHAALKARPITAWGNAPRLPQANRSRSTEGATYHSLGLRPRFAATESITQR